MIAVDHLTKRYGTVAAVDGLGFEVRQPNGLAIARRAVVLAGRPAETLPDVILRGQSAAHGLSCPSGHAMVIFAITALVAPYFKGW